MKRVSDLTLLRHVLHRHHLAVDLGIQFPQRSWRSGGQQGAFEAFVLQRLNAHDDGVHDRINRRAALHAKITACAQDGFVALYESGMDCDCVTFAGVARHKVPAALLYVQREMDEIERWADGPISLSVISPSEAVGVAYKTRDNVMEAYEDGHPHAVVARMPQ